MYQIYYTNIKVIILIEFKVKIKEIYILYKKNSLFRFYN